MESWHQQHARRRDHALRNVPAHIVDEKVYGFVSLCGERVPQVTVAAEHASNPKNKTCSACLKIHANTGE